MSWPQAIASTHWGRVTHICVSNLTIIGPDNGLSPGGRQDIIWTNAGILLIGPWGTNFSEILIGIQTFSFKKIHLKMSSAKWRPFCLSLNVLNHSGQLGLNLFWPLNLNNEKLFYDDVSSVDTTEIDQHTVLSGKKLDRDRTYSLMVDCFNTVNTYHSISFWDPVTTGLLQSWT